MTLKEMQADLQHSFAGGGPGTIVSGLVWLTAAITTTLQGLSTGYLTLFFGGMIIFPVGTLIVRFVMKRPAQVPGNIGGRLVVETLPAMIGILLVGLLLIDVRPDWVFPLAAIAVGARYFPFRTAYGSIVYWILGAAMVAVGGASLMTLQPAPMTVPYMIAIIEIGFGVWMTLRK